MSRIDASRLWESWDAQRQSWERAKWKISKIKNWQTDIIKESRFSAPFHFFVFGFLYYFNEKLMTWGISHAEDSLFFISIFQFRCMDIYNSHSDQNSHFLVIVDRWKKCFDNKSFRSESIEEFIPNRILRVSTYLIE